jgi:hypothetical protein
MTHLNLSLINFGGKNDSPFEFYNTGDDQSARFFKKTNDVYSSFPNAETTINQKFLLFGLLGVEYGYLINEVNIWFKQNIKTELLNKLSDKEYSSNTVNDFNLGDCKMSNVFKYILTKDKGVGGFEQCNSNRKSNVVKHYKKMMDASRKIDKSKFIDSLKYTYFQDDGFTSPMKGKDIVKHSDYFMKGRKEGVDNKKYNYYLDNIVSTRNNDKNFESVGRIILCLYDIITFEMASGEVIPESFDNNSEITSKKCHLIETQIKRKNLDAMFITEYLPGSLETDSSLNSTLNSDYNISVGEELDGLANAIIYKKSLGDFSTVTYPHDSEFKEYPLVIRSNLFSMICYHAGGKGILENVTKFTDTHLFKYIESCGKVIMGGDFNCNIYNNCEIFGVSENDNIEITSFKQRTSVQPQFDKSNRRDKSKKDDFVVKDCDIVGCNVTMIIGERGEDDGGEDDGGDDGCEDDGCDDDEHEVSIYKDCDDSYLIPNNSHPFDHYFVNYSISLKPEPEPGSNYYYTLIYNFISSFFQY